MERREKERERREKRVGKRKFVNLLELFRFPLRMRDTPFHHRFVGVARGTVTVVGVAVTVRCATSRLGEHSKSEVEKPRTHCAVNSLLV